MPKMKIVVLPNLDSILYGYSIIHKKKNQFFIGSHLNSLSQCPENMIEQVKKQWEEGIKNEN